MDKVMMLSVRRFSTSTTLYKRILPAVDVSHITSPGNGRPEGFERNFPIARRQKAWEKTGEDKETYFKRKHAHTHAMQKKRAEYASENGDSKSGRRSDKVDFKKEPRPRRSENNDNSRESRYSDDHNRRFRDGRSSAMSGKYRERESSRFSESRSAESNDFNDMNDFESRPRREKREVYSGIRPSPLSEFIYGTNSVFAALSAKRREYFSRLLTFNPKPEDQEIIDLAKKENIRVQRAKDKNELNILSNNGVHNGFVLETKPMTPQPIHYLDESNFEKGTYRIIDDELGEKITRECKTENPHPFGVYLDEISDPHNVGAIIRSAYFLGADFVVVSSKNCAPLSPVVSKTSVGAIEFLPIYSATSPLSFLDKSREKGWIVVSGAEASHPTDSKINQTLRSKEFEYGALNSLLGESPVLLVVGSEGKGIRTTMKLRSDYLVQIASHQNVNPMVDSLNVSVATGLLIQKIMDI